MTTSTRSPQSNCKIRNTRLASVALALLLTSSWPFASRALAQPQTQTTTVVTPATRAPDETVILEQLVVRGARESLIFAQEIKKESLQFTDSVVAEDIGKLPDNTVADALQRVPGIQVARTNGEVSLVLIRGLPNIGTTLDGNEIFTGVSRGVALQDIPAELVAGVDVYKSTNPENVEGGIAGLIDIRLRKPLDFSKPQIAASARYIMGENAGKNGYVGSVLLSDQWDVGKNGKLGVLYSGAYQQRYFVDQIAFNFLFEPVPVPTTIQPSGTLQLPFTQGAQTIPGDRSRTGQTLSLQWRVNPSLEIYDTFLYTNYRDEHQVYFLIGFPRFGAITAATVHPGTDVPISTTSNNNFHLTSMQAFKQATDGYQNVLGAKWTRGNSKLTGEYLFNWNRVKNQALIVDTRFGATPADNFIFTYNDDERANLAIPGTAITTIDRYFLWGLFDNHDVATSQQNGGLIKLEQTLPRGFFQKIVAGLRVSDRSARSQATSRNDIAPLGTTNGDRAATAVPNISTIPGFGTVSPDGPLEYYSTPHWVTASPDYLYANPDSVRALFGLPPGPAPFNPTLAFSDDEFVSALFFNAIFSTRIGGHLLDGTIGVRAVGTRQKLQGYRTDGTPIDSDNTESDVLPVLNARYRLTDQWQLRLAAGRTITRPDFDDLNPAVTLNAPTTTGGAAGTGTGGNPDLTVVTSDNLDLGIEYYFAKDSFVSLTGFYRKIDGYVQTFAATEVIDGIPYVVIRPRNSGKGHLTGFEAVYQHFPRILHGLGWMLNYTYIDGNTDAPDTTPNAPVGARVRKPYAQVAKNAYSAILIYETGKFSSRLAWTWRGEFTDTFDGPNAPGSPLRQITVKPLGTLDFGASYEITKNFTITLDATNLLKTEYHDYFFDPSLYPRDTRAYDRTLEVGVRYRY